MCHDSGADAVVARGSALAARGACGRGVVGVVREGRVRRGLLMKITVGKECDAAAPCATRTVVVDEVSLRVSGGIGEPRRSGPQWPHGTGIRVGRPPDWREHHDETLTGHKTAGEEWRPAFRQAQRPAASPAAT